MGNQLLILLFGTLVVFALFMVGFREKGNELTRNSSDSFAEAAAHEVNRSAMDLAMRQLADSITWRAAYSNMSLLGGTTTVTFADTVIGTDSAIVVHSTTQYVAGMDTGWASSRAIVQQAGYLPPVVRGAFTAFGPLNDAISDMVIDGRNFRSDGVTMSAQKGIYAVSTGQASFTNNDFAQLGGTTYTTSPPTDIAPAFPHSPLVVETNSSWPNGWPTTPDRALNLPAGTLKTIAQTGSVPGSQYVTSAAALTYPLRGVTFIEVADSVVEEIQFGTNPSGIVVMHSPSTSSRGEKLLITGGPFKGLIVMDNAFHIHMDILGAIVLLTPNTVEGRNCNGNAGHSIRYSSETIMDVTAQILSSQTVGGSWKNTLRVLSWYE